MTGRGSATTTSSPQARTSGFISFGGGPHRCFGTAMAYPQAQFPLAQFHQRFRLQTPATAFEPDQQPAERRRRCRAARGSTGALGGQGSGRFDHHHYNGSPAASDTQGSVVAAAGELQPRHMGFRDPAAP
jgi:Cytochrome P450